MRRASGLAKMRSSPLPRGAVPLPLTLPLRGSCAALPRSRGRVGVRGDGAGSGGAAGAAPASPASPPAAAGCPANSCSSAAASSPSSSSTAIGWLTLMPCAPSGTMILPMRPSSTASYSIVALSVSISAMTSPAWTSSPSFFSQRARLPSVIVGDSAGIRISIGMSPTSPFSLVMRARTQRGDPRASGEQRHPRIRSLRSAP